MATSPLSTLALISLLTVPPAALARDGAHVEADRSGCTLTVKKGDLVAQGKTLVVEGRGEGRNALAIDGDVVVRAGSTVKDVVALRGKVTIEAGARVLGDVSALGGDVRLEKGASIAGDVNAIGGRIDAAEGTTISGEKSQLTINLNGEELFRGLMGSFAPFGGELVKLRVLVGVCQSNCLIERVDILLCSDGCGLESADFFERVLDCLIGCWVCIFCCWWSSL